jgi:hypothetical protein
MTMTTALIPTNGVFVTETQYPKGFTVARYDARGFAQEPRWFETLASARSHAEKL